MDANLFSRIVKELLADSGKAVVPGLGNFFIEDVPASFSDRGFTLNPPYRRVAFMLSDEKDDALASFYAKSNGLDIRKAEAILRDYVITLRDGLSSLRTVVLPDFGQLRMAGRKCVVFVPDEGLSIFPQFDVLEPLSLKSRNFTADVPQEEDRWPSTASEQVSSPAKAESADQSQDVTDTGSGRRHPFIVVIIVLLVAAAVLLVSLAVVGRVAPELIDPFLYDAQQLEILYKPL